MLIVPVEKGVTSEGVLADASPAAASWVSSVALEYYRIDANHTSVRVT